MADKRYNESTIGNPGRLVYYPPEVRRAEDWGWLTVRNHQNDAPNIIELGSHRQWLNSTSQKPPSNSSRSAWHENRKQKRWLLKNHPEAALAEEELGDLLAVENAPRQHSRIATWQFNQFAVGEMTDTSSPQQTVSAPLLAMATGSAGDVLRIARPAVNFWSLSGSENTAVRLLEHAPHQETLWTKDIGTIRFIRSIVSTRRFDPVRWLAVQRDASTTVFRPEYQKVPVVSETFSGTGPQAPSHIAPNLLFTISKNQTGGNPHCHLDFNPGVRSIPAQLAIVDDGGNWTLWEVTGTRKRVAKNPKAQLFKCGNIYKGVRECLKRKVSPQPQWHKIYWVGRAQDTSDEDFDEEDIATAEVVSSFPPLERSSILLVCNEKLLRLLDFAENNFLPDLRFLSEGSKDVIIDVQVDGRDLRYFYVITTSRLFVVAVLTVDDAVSKRASILQSFPHLRSKLDRNLKVTIMNGPASPTERTTLVVLYSQYTNWHDVFCIKFSRQFPERIVCHHGSFVSQDTVSKVADKGLQTLCVVPTPLFTQQPSGGFDTRQKYLDPGAIYFQLFSFGTDLSLSYCLGTSSIINRKNEIVPRKVPDVELAEGVGKGLRIHVTKSDRLSRQEFERQRAVRYLSTRFIVADSLAEFRYRAIAATGIRSAKMRTANPARRMMAPVHEEFRGMLARLWADSDSSSKVDIDRAAEFDPVFVTLQEALETRRLPLKSMFEMMQHFRMPANYRETSQEWQIEIEQLGRVDSSLQIFHLDKPRRSLNDAYSLEELFSGLVNLTLGENRPELVSDDNNGTTFLLLGRIACDLFLSQHGMTYLPPEIAEVSTGASMDIRSSPTLMPEDMLIDHQESIRSTIRSSSLAFDSQGSSRASTPASTIQSVATRTEDGDEIGNGGMAIIRALTGSAMMAIPKKTKLPSTWNVGEDVPITIFDVDNNTEVTEGMRRRAKQEAREARKRKRAENFLQLQRENNLLPSTQPLLNMNSYTQASQPFHDFSSQPRVLPSAPAFAMSQPVAGIFGGRSDHDRPKKKPKRKGGF